MKIIKDKIMESEEEIWQKACEANTTEAYRAYREQFPMGEYRAEALLRMQRCPTGNNSMVSRNEEQEEKLHNDPWECVDKNDIVALREFRRRNPRNAHSREALRLINSLRELAGLTGSQRIERVIAKNPDDIVAQIIHLLDNGNATEDDLIEVFRKDNNVLTPDCVEQLKDAVDLGRLEEAGIDKRFIDQILSGERINVVQLNTAVPALDRIPDGFTEIYFWGVPSSGKTCAVGSIMSAMTNGVGVRSVMPITSSQGAGYMMPLASRFYADRICVLPPRTKVDETFEMRYIITDDKGKEHPLAFIDLSGELYECMYKVQTNQPLTKIQEGAMNVLRKILVTNKSTNPKLHFFVIEYGAERRMYRDLTQQDLLNNALCFLDENNILRDNTIGAYIIITKADKANDDNIGQYIDTYYSGFYSGLQKRMEDYGVNTRKGKAQVKRFPFSIGKVCFQNWCICDSEWTQYIIQEIKERSYGIETGLFGIFKDLIQG